MPAAGQETRRSRRYPGCCSPAAYVTISYSKQMMDYQLLYPQVGRDRLTSDGEHWLRQRRLRQPAFHLVPGHAVAKAGPITLTPRSGRQMTARLWRSASHFQQQDGGAATG